MPDEKSKGVASGDRDFHRARRTLYTRKDRSSDEEDDGKADQSQSLLSDRLNKNGKRIKVKTNLSNKTKSDSSNMEQMEKEQISGVAAGQKTITKRLRSQRKSKIRQTLSLE